MFWLAPVNKSQISLAMTDGCPYLWLTYTQLPHSVFLSEHRIYSETQEGNILRPPLHRTLCHLHCLTTDPRLDWVRQLYSRTECTSDALWHRHQRSLNDRESFRKKPKNILDKMCRGKFSSSCPVFPALPSLGCKSEGPRFYWVFSLPCSYILRTWVQSPGQSSLVIVLAPVRQPVHSPFNHS